MKGYFAKFEKFIANKNQPVDKSEPQRGKSGPMTTGLSDHFSGWAQRFILAATSIGITRRFDFNTSEGTLGVGKVSRRQCHAVTLTIS